MKWFILVLSVYMLLLSCMPCNDSSDCSDEVATAVSENMPEHDEHKENCTPFCVCACCAVPVIQNIQASIVHSVSKNIVLKISYEEDFFSSNLHNIWQPPRPDFS